MRTINPETIAKPASNYAHGVIHTSVSYTHLTLPTIQL